jgi:KEOPS complex subunit Pcc1
LAEHQNIRTIIEIEFENAKNAMFIFKSIKPEIHYYPSERSLINLEIDGQILKLKIHSKDTPSFRASLNSYLRWIILSKEILTLKNTKN